MIPSLDWERSAHDEAKQDSSIGGRRRLAPLSFLLPHFTAFAQMRVVLTNLAKLPLQPSNLTCHEGVHFMSS